MGDARIYLLSGMLAALGVGAAPAVAAPDRIFINKFAQGPDNPTMNVLVKGRKGWQPLRNFAVGDSARFHRSVDGLADASTCASGGVFSTIYQQSQLPAMNKYFETGYLTPEEGSVYVKNSVDFTDRPVTFYQMVSDTPPDHGLAGMGRPDGHLKIGLDFAQPAQPGLLEQPLPRDGFIRASTYMVSGQKLTGRQESVEPALVPVDLPWMKDPEFSEQAQTRFGRDKYKLAWEMGRVMSTQTGAFEEILGLAGNGVLKEVMHVGVPDVRNLDHAYVTIHVLNAANEAKFLARFPECEIIPSKSDPKGNVVLVIALRDYLKRFPPENFDAAQRIVKDSISPATTAPKPLSPVARSALITSWEYSQRPVLDFRYRGYFTGRPLMMSAGKSGIAEVQIAHLAKYGFGLSADDFERLRDANVMSTVALLGDPLFPKWMADPAMESLIPEAKLPPRTLQIYNLDPELAKNNPGYVRAAVVASFEHYLRTFLGQHAGNPAAERQLIEPMIRDGVHFMVTTQHPTTAQAAEQLKPMLKLDFDLSHEATAQRWWAEYTRISGKPRPSLTEEGFVFNMSQVLAFRAEEKQAAVADRGQSYPLAAPGEFWWLMGSAQP